MVKSKEELDRFVLTELSDDNIEVFKPVIIDRCMDHPKSKKFTCSKNVCLAHFAWYYCTKSTSENDYQPEILKDIENKAYDFAMGLPKKIC